MAPRQPPDSSGSALSMSLLLIAACCTPACITIKTRIHVVNKVIGERARLIKHGKGRLAVSATLQQQNVTVRALRQPRCIRQRVQRVGRTKRFLRSTPNPAGMWLELIGGGLLAGGGLYFTASAGFRPDYDDPYSRDEFSKEGSLGLGVPLLVVGAALVGAGVYQAVGLMDSTRELSPYDRVAARVVVDCGPQRPVRGGLVTLNLVDGSPPQTAKTDDDGSATFPVDLRLLASVPQDRVANAHVSLERREVPLQLSENAIYKAARAYVARVAAARAAALAAAASRKKAQAAARAALWKKLEREVDLALARGSLTDAVAALDRADGQRGDEALKDRIAQKRAAIGELSRACPIARKQTFEGLKSRTLQPPSLKFILWSFFGDAAAGAADEFAARRSRRKQRRVRRRLRKKLLFASLEGPSMLSIGRYDFKRHRVRLSLDSLLFAGRFPQESNKRGKDGLLLTTRKPSRLLAGGAYGVRPPPRKLKQFFIKHKDEVSAESWVKANKPASLRVDLVIKLGRPWTLRQREAESLLIKVARRHYQKVARKTKGATRQFARVYAKALRPGYLDFAGLTYRAKGVQVFNTKTGEVLYSWPRAECRKVTLCDNADSCDGLLRCHGGRCVPPWRASGSGATTEALTLQ